jgi:hypothetical protein
MFLIALIIPAVALSFFSSFFWSFFVLRQPVEQKERRKRGFEKFSSKGEVG